MRNVCGSGWDIKQNAQWIELKFLYFKNKMMKSDFLSTYFENIKDHWQNSLKSKLLKMIPMATKGDKG